MEQIAFQEQFRALLYTLSRNAPNPIDVLDVGEVDQEVGQIPNHVRVFESKLPSEVLLGEDMKESPQRMIGRNPHLVSVAPIGLSAATRSRNDRIMPQFRTKQQGAAFLTRRSICPLDEQALAQWGDREAGCSEYCCLPLTTVTDDRRHNPYTAQVPPNPMLTLPLSTMTGTSLAPFENSNIRSIAFLSFLTST